VGEWNGTFTHHPLIFGKYVLHATEGDKDGKDSRDKLYVFDEDGNLIWSFEGEDNMNGVVANPDFIVVTDDAGYVYALSWEGRLLWKFRANRKVKSMSIGDLDGDGYLDVVVGSRSRARDNHIYALSGKDGRLLWKFKTISFVGSSPALGDLDGDGYIDMAVASFDGYLYVFEATKKGGEVVWSRWHGDAAGTGLYENAVSFAQYNLSGRAFAWYPHKTSARAFALKPPYLEITSVKLYDEDSDKLFEAGEKGKLVVKITNTGKGSAYNLRLKVSSPFFNKTIRISKIEPNQEITKEIIFKIPIRVKTRKVYVNVELDAGKYSPEPVKVAFTTKAPIPPKFKIAYKIDDDRVGESIGNSNGIIEPRETIELLITVKNTGKGGTKDVKVKLSSYDVDIIKGTAKIGNLPPGASASGKLVPCSCPKDFNN